MASDNRELDAAAVDRLTKLIQAAGGRQDVAARMAEANGIARPSKPQVASQAKRLRRILTPGDVTIKSLNLVAKALGKPLTELLAYLFGDATEPATSAAPRLGLGQSQLRDESRNTDPGWLAPGTETGRLYLRLNKASELTANRTNVVRDEVGLPVITLQDQLYVRRDIEAEIARALESRTTDTPFIVIDGEAGTGKSSVLWATERGLRETGAPAWLIDATELPGIFGPGSILSDTFRELVRNLGAAGRPPVILIDTIDVPLNRSGADVYVASLLTDLALAGVRWGKMEEKYVEEPEQRKWYLLAAYRVHLLKGRIPEFKEQPGTTAVERKGRLPGT